MSLKGYWNDLISQQPFGTSDGIAATDASVNAQEQAITDQQLASGLITQATYDQIQSDYAAQPDSSVAGQTDQLDQALQEGAAQGLQNEAAAVGSVVKGAGNVTGALLGGVIRNIPWWVWLGLALYLFIWLGGGGFVERRARERLSR